MRYTTEIIQWLMKGGEIDLPNLPNWYDSTSGFAISHRFRFRSIRFRVFPERFNTTLRAFQWEYFEREHRASEFPFNTIPEKVIERSPILHEIVRKTNLIHKIDDEVIPSSVEVRNLWKTIDLGQIPFNHERKVF